MSLEDDASLLRQRFNAQWSALRPTVPVAWPNTSFDPPNGPWVRFTIVPNETRRLAIGNEAPQRLYRNYGRVWIQCFTLAQIGDHEALALADDAGAIFNEWASGGLRCEAPEITAGPENDDKWFNVTVSVKYQSDFRR